MRYELQYKKSGPLIRIWLYLLPILNVEGANLGQNDIKYCLRPSNIYRLIFFLSQ